MLRVPLVGRFVLLHLGEDPWRLAVQVLLRLPDRVRRRAGTLTGRLVGRRPGALAVLSAWAGEDRTGLDAAVGRLTRRGGTRAGADAVAAARAAVVLLAAGETVLAERVLTGLPDDDADLPDQALTILARLAWTRGRLDDAAAVLRRRARPGAAPARSLAGERAVLVDPWPAFDRAASTAATRPRPQTRAVGRRPRVLHLLTNSLPRTTSGYAYRSHEVLRAQQGAGVDVLAVTRLGYPVVTGALAAPGRDVVDGVRYLRDVPALMAGDPWGRLVQQTDRLEAVARRHRPDVLHTTTHYLNAMPTAEVARRLGVPWVYEVRGLLEDTWRSTQPAGAETTDRYRWSRDRETAAMCAADAVVTLSEGMADEVCGRGVPRESVLVAPNAVSGRLLEVPRADVAAVRRRAGIRTDRLVMGTATSVVPYEGLDTAVRSLPLLAAAGVDAHLLLVGDGTALAGLRSLAASLGLQDRVTFLGRVPRASVQPLVDAMDVFVVPRRDDPVCRVVTPLKPLEAMARGVPVVASDLPALREIVHEGRTGALAAPEDPASLAEAVARLAADPGHRERLGAAARRWVRDNRTWEANGMRYSELYARVLDDRAVPA